MGICLRPGLPFWLIQKNGDTIVLSFPKFFFNNDEGRGGGSGIGAKHQSL
jgi:hypothetical protein